MPCTDVFKILHINPPTEACKEVAEHFPECCCEHETVQPTISPGPVLDCEILTRFIPNDERYYDPQKGLTIKNFEYVVKKGLSVDRLAHANPSELFIRQAEMGHLGYINVSAATLRKHRFKSDITNGQQPVDERLFAIYDTALETNKAHADVCLIFFSETLNMRNPTSLRAKFRRDLQQLFGVEVRRFEEPPISLP